MARLVLTADQRRTLNELLRPTATRLRAILYTGQANLGLVQSLLASVQAQITADPSLADEPIDDGRDAEGVRPITAAELATGIGFLLQMLAWTQEPANVPAGDAALKIAPFPFVAE